MDAIKKKMQAMKLEKDNALDRAAHMEQLAKDANLRAEKVLNLFYSFLIINLARTHRGFWESTFKLEMY